MKRFKMNAAATGQSYFGMCKDARIAVDRDKVLARCPVRTLKDMSRSEIAALEKLYSMPVKA